MHRPQVMQISASTRRTVITFGAKPEYVHDGRSTRQNICDPCLCINRAASQGIYCMQASRAQVAVLCAWAPGSDQCFARCGSFRGKDQQWPYLWHFRSPCNDMQACASNLNGTDISWH